MNTGAANADEDSQIPRGPSWIYIQQVSMLVGTFSKQNDLSHGRPLGDEGGILTLVALAVSAHLIGLKFQQTLDGLLILGSLARGSTSRHNLLATRSDDEKGETMGNPQCAGGGRCCGLRLRSGSVGWGGMCQMRSLMYIASATLAQRQGSFLNLKLPGLNLAVRLYPWTYKVTGNTTSRYQ